MSISTNRTSYSVELYIFKVKCYTTHLVITAPTHVAYQCALQRSFYTIVQGPEDAMPKKGKLLAGIFSALPEY
jgi:hypothetical protein